MATNDNSLRALREAVQLSPDNVPLRGHFASVLLRAGRPDEAEREFRQALAREGGNRDLKVGLADAFFRQGKYSQSLVVVEDLLQGPDVPAPAYLLYAQLLLRNGEVDRAGRYYREALELDPSLADPELAEQIGVEPLRERPEEEIEEEEVEEEWREEGAAVERPKVTFADVGGMESLKEEIRLKIIHPLSHPELYAAYGKGIGGGILLYGPPGCGKTHLARATAGEVRASFLAVGINDVLDMWLGQSERNLHDVFAEARANKPCVLFFDEVDALGANRSDLRQSGIRQLINQFLAELDGIGASNKGVLVLAATNAPWHLDPAFRRPGRFDRIVFVPPPDAGGRAEILRLLCRDKPQQGLDFVNLGRRMEGYSGADLQAVVDRAVEAKLREALRHGEPRPLTTRDLVAAAALVQPSTREWFAAARNYALYANQGGLYDEVLKYLKL
jgi:SpoVK/Ycf46/Vps4 family AAA+-type ATPase